MAHSLTWPVAFALTLAVEALVSAAVLRGCRVRLPWRAWAVTLLVANLTHPVLWWVLSQPGMGVWELLVAEAVVAAVEAVVWWGGLRWAEPPEARRWRWLAAIAVALGANAASVAFGVVVQLSVRACS